MTDLSTSDDAGLPPAIPFAAPSTGVPDRAPTATEVLPAQLPFDPFQTDADTPPLLRAVTKAIRPLCVGALMAIPTLGAATVGAVALFSERRALAMVRASTQFLAGIPGEVVLLIGALATGYGFAKTIEALRDRRQ